MNEYEKLRSMRNIDDFKLTSTVTVGDMSSWVESRDPDSKNKIIDFVNHIFNHRFIEQLDKIDSGFLIMAVSCLTIETYESFIKGRDDSKGSSRRMFKSFFNREAHLFPGFKSFEIDFYSNIRCGILHQSDTKHAWRIIMEGDLLNKEERIINARKFADNLKQVIVNYMNKLSEENMDSKIWKKTIEKIKAICKNCNY